MGVLPIGFFSPLPLAMMIPFMATQSLAMGEAFGKSFQYGKRKISSMSNEEFNKYTFQNMMDEQTANIKMIVPKLSQQMSDSFQLQVHIFDEMIKLIPAFFESLMKALAPLSDQFSQFGTTPFNQQVPPPSGGTLVSASPPPDITLIENFPETPDIPIIEKSYNQAEFRAMSDSQLKYKINNELKGSELSLAEHVLKTRIQKEDATQGDTAHQQWLQKLFTLKKEFIQHKTTLARNSGGKRAIELLQQIARKKIIPIKSAIRTMSNDYRSSNNAIRRSALTLRQQIANGLLK